MGFFGVRRGRTAGVYASWDEAQSHVIGFPGALCRKFKTAGEAQAFVEGTDAPPRAAAGGGGGGGGGAGSKRAADSDRVLEGDCSMPSKRRRRSSSPIAVTPPPDRGGARLPYQDLIAEVWTDGACSKNGTKDARAGVGIVFSHDRIQDIGAPLPERYPQTSSCSELVAAYTAVLYARAHPKHFADTVRIHTDSAYVIGCATTWCHGWKRRDWLKANGRKPEHLDLIRRMYKKLWREGSDGEPRARKHPRIEFVKVKGHSGVPGNERADRLAVLGANRERDESESEFDSESD